MEKAYLALITPCLLPVPAVLGGAVEVLLTNILEENEKKAKYMIDLYTIDHELLAGKSYQYTNIIAIGREKPMVWGDRVIDKICREFPFCNNGYRMFDYKIAALFERRIVKLRKQNFEYDKVIVQNLVSLAIQIRRRMKKQQLNCPMYFHMHNDIDIYRSPQGLRRLHREGTQFIVISKYIESQIVKYVSGVQIHILYNGVDREVFRSSGKKETGEITFLYSGRLIPDKGVLELLEAFEALLMGNEHEKIKLVIAGSSDFSRDTLTGYEQRVQNIVERISESVELTGKVDEKRMVELYDRADVVVIPSIWEEPFGMVALEAMAMGKPIISTFSGGLAEVLDDTCAIRVDKRNQELFVEQLTDAMRALLKDEVRRKMGKASQERIKRHPEFWKENFYMNFDRILKIAKVE